MTKPIVLAMGIAGGMTLLDRAKAIYPIPACSRQTREQVQVLAEILAIDPAAAVSGARYPEPLNRAMQSSHVTNEVLKAFIEIEETGAAQ